MAPARRKRKLNIGSIKAPTRLCDAHPTYIGRTKPTILCERCWQVWFGMSDSCLSCGCLEAEMHVIRGDEEDGQI